MSVSGILSITIFGTVAAAVAVLNPVSAKLAGQECALWEDAQGITHAKAEGELATYACMGFLHGRDRAWQMDYLRRVTQGRRSEILGRTQLRSDILMRVLGFHSRAEAILEKSSAVTRERLWAYAHGVNQGFAARPGREQYEFTRLGYKPEEWQPADSIALVLLQAFDQTRKTFEQDLTEEKQKELGWAKDMGVFSSEGLPWDATVLKKGEYARASAAASAPASRRTGSIQWVQEALDALPDFFPGAGQGSNNWVVSPSRSRTGRAWLANDPHLDLKHPPFWYWAHLSGGGLEVIGASLPGLPLIASGSNAHVAWGLTNSYLDVADVSAVPEDELGDTKREWPVIWVKLGPVKLPFFFKSFRRTSHGWPVLPLDGPKGKALVLRWTGFDVEGSDIEAFHSLMTSRSSKEIDQALSRVGIPSWNFVFADTGGTIGYRAVGRIPRRMAAPPYGVPARSLREIEKWEFLTATEMPHVLRPGRGWVATANNRQWPADSSFHGGRGYSNGFRALRIEELLVKTWQHDLASMKKIQCDVQAVDARFILPRLIAHLSDEESRSPAVALLRLWNYQTTLESRAAAIYRRWVDLLMAEHGWNEAALYRQLEPGVHERIGESVNAALRTALTEIDVKKTWGEQHRIAFTHLSGVAELEVPAVGSPGDDNSVNPGSLRWDPAKGYYEHTTGASHRLVVELTSPPTVHAMLAGPNQDIEKRDLSAKGSDWGKWIGCELDRRVFPVEWESVRKTRVKL